MVGGERRGLLAVVLGRVGRATLVSIDVHGGDEAGLSASGREGGEGDRTGCRRREEEDAQEGDARGERDPEGLQARGEQIHGSTRRWNVLQQLRPMRIDRYRAVSWLRAFLWSSRKSLRLKWMTSATARQTTAIRRQVRGMAVASSLLLFPQMATLMTAVI